jgi:hypothetical protein
MLERHTQPIVETPASIVNDQLGMQLHDRWSIGGN